MNKKNKILVGCLALLLVLSVGYALFSDTITINGTATAKGSFDITTTCQTSIPSEFGTLESLGLEAEGGYNNESCSVVDDNVSISVGLEYPGAKKYFFVEMKNTGSIDAALNLYDMSESVNGEFCIANNKEGTNAKCQENKDIWYGNQLEVSPMYDGLILPVAFVDETGVITWTDETFFEKTSEYFDATSFDVFLSPNQRILFLVTGYFHEYYHTEVFGENGEFFISREFTIEYPWQQKAN